MKKKIRVFSESLKREKVRMIECGQMTRSEVAKLYGITYNSVTKWIKKYGTLPNTERGVVETDSESYLL
jgi:transposase-like protein